MTLTLRLVTALVVSLCANAFMGGLLVAQHAPPPASMGAMAGEGMRNFSGHMPPDVRGMMADVMRDQRGAIGEKMAAMKQTRTAVVDALKAEPFEANKLREALTAQRSAQADVQSAVHESIVAAIEKMTPEQRAKVANNAGKLFR